MGLFSWLTNDTNESIPAMGSSRFTFPVYMKDNKGNVWYEDEYEGYGIFGGKDFYELVAEMNGHTSDKTGEAYTDYMRNIGIDLACYEEDAKKHLTPCLFRYKDSEWVPECPKSCPDQGYFYYEEEECDDCGNLIDDCTCGDDEDDICDECGCFDCTCLDD